MCDPPTAAHEQLSSLFVSDVISDTICNRSSYTHCNLLWHLHFSAATQHSLPAPEAVTSHPVEWKMQTVSRAVLQQLPALHHQLKYNAVNVFPPFKTPCRLLLCSSLKESIQTTSFQEAFVWRYKRSTWQEVFSDATITETFIGSEPAPPGFWWATIVQADDQ